MSILELQWLTDWAIYHPNMYLFLLFVSILLSSTAGVIIGGYFIEKLIVWYESHLY